MSGTIQGLSCAACKNAISADGVTCGACSASHHWPCYASAGHCASCMAAKPPIPFGVAPMARSSWTGAALGVALVSSLAALGATMLSLHRPPPPPLPPFPPPPFNAMMPRPAQPPRLDFGSDAQRIMSFKKLKQQLLQKKGAPQLTGADPRLFRYPGRLSGFLSATIQGGAASTPEIVELRGTPVRTAFLEAEVRAGGTVPQRYELRFEGRTLSEKDGVAQWIGAGKVQAPPTGHRWYRMDFAQPVDAVRINFAIVNTNVALHTFIALLDERPAGEAVECAKAATIKSIDEGYAVLTSGKGKTVRVPSELLTQGLARGNVSVATRKGALVARLGREGNVSVFDPRTAMAHSWGTHIASLHASKHVQWMKGDDDDGNTWINGIGAYTLLTRWNPSLVREVVYSSALEASAVLNSDGTATVYRPQSGGGGLPVIEFDDVGDLEATIGLIEATDTPPYTARRQRAQMRAGALGVNTPLGGKAFTRSQAELVRWLKQDVLPLFRKLAPPPTGPAAGDRVWVGWRNSHTHWGYLGTLQVTMLDRESVMVRPAERGSAATSMAEFELPRDFLPDQPETRVGQTVWLEPESR